MKKRKGNVRPQRKRLEGQIREAGWREGRVLSKYGEKSPQLWLVDSLYDQLTRPEQFGEPDCKLPLSEIDGERFLGEIRAPTEILLNEFARAVLRRDDKFFTDVAAAIRILNSHLNDGGPSGQQWRYKLCDPRFGWCNPPATLKQIKEYIGYTGTNAGLRDLLNELKVPWTRSRGGRPRKSSVNKKVKTRRE